MTSSPLTSLGAGTGSGGVGGGGGAAAALVAAPSRSAPPVAGASMVGVPALLGEPLAEAAVLGCVLRGGTAVARDVLHQLTDQDWTVPVHAHVAAAAAVLLERGQPVDPVTVLGQLRRQGVEDARTASRDTGVLLVELCQAAPCVSSAQHYLRIVLEHSYRRRAQQAAVRLLQSAETGSLTDLAAVVAREHAALSSCQSRLHATSATHPA